jgi:hypothetical protein
MAKKITLDPSPLPSSGEAKLRSLTYVDAYGETQTVKALMSADVDIPAGGLPTGFGEVENAVVHIQLDTSSDPYKIQVKRGTVLAKSVDATWSDLVVPSAFDA